MTIVHARLNRVFLPLVVAGLSLALAAVALAHHSQSEFDSKLGVDVEGKVTRLEWKSPHARLYVDVVDKEGRTENWNFELASPTTLMRRGWKRDSLKAGDQVRVTGSRALHQGWQWQAPVYRCNEDPRARAGGRGSKPGGRASVAHRKVP